MKRVTMKVASDHVHALTNARPVVALAELVWNALDADATLIRVDFDQSLLNGSIAGITVTDNGTGMTEADAEAGFGSIGGSWKRNRQKTRTRGRTIHGKEGKGRLRAYALGEDVEWRTVTGEPGRLQEFRIKGSKQDIRQFDISDSIPSDDTQTGTTVSIGSVRPNLAHLLKQSTREELLELFALYLRNYPDISVVYHKSRLHPADLELHVQEYRLDSVQVPGGTWIHDMVLTIVEWKTEFSRSLHLCDANGFSLFSFQPRIHAPGFSYTCYLRTSYIKELEEANLLELGPENPVLEPIVAAAKKQLRDHFRARAAEQRADLVEEWKRDKVYPYQGQPRDVVEQVERQMFDVLAINVNNYMPSFAEADPTSKKFSFELLKGALKENPEALQRIFRDVLALPSDKQNELARLLERTSLSAVIEAANMVAERLEFIRGLEILLYDPVSKKTLLERKELHRILARETWIFGEEYNLTVDDESLNEVLLQHRSTHLRPVEDPLQDEGEKTDAHVPVVRSDGSDGIIDLMLSRLIYHQDASKREHLVVELKRPRQKITPNVAQQIKSYALAVQRDERFRDLETKWVFWAVSNDIHPDVRSEIQQDNRPRGILYQNSQLRMTVWVKSWSEVINDCKARLKMFEEKLQFTADRAAGLDYLKRTHSQYLPDHLKSATPPS